MRFTHLLNSGPQQRVYIMSTIRDYQTQVQDIIEKAIATVEEQHKALAAASFDYIEKLYKIDTVKAKHDDVAELAYNKAREVNKLVADYANEVIGKFDKEAPVAKAKTAAKKTAATAKKTATTAKKKATKAVKSTAAKAEAATTA